MCNIKSPGRLGEKDLECFNMALLSKLLWRFYRERGSLWARVIESRWGCRGGWDFTEEVGGEK